MVLVIVETVSAVPLYPLEPTDTDKRVLDCLGQENATWIYSLLSIDRLRMMCRFEAPDAEAVRRSYRRAGGPFHRIWSGQIVAPAGPPRTADPATLKVFEGTYPDGFTDADWDHANHHILPCYLEHGVEWVQSFVSGDRTRVVCEINAPDAEVIRAAHRRFAIPFDRVWPAMVISPELVAQSALA
jgi:hypothetical protein